MTYFAINDQARNRYLVVFAAPGLSGRVICESPDYCEAQMICDAMNARYPRTGDLAEAPAPTQPSEQPS